MILICYDGSPDSKSAVEHAAELFPGEPVTVLTVWQPFVEVIAKTTVGFGMVPSIPDADELDDASRKSAEQAAGEGVELARKLGMDAEPQTCAQTSSIARTILGQADKLGARAIVIDGREVTAVGERLPRGDPARRPHSGRRPLA
jgi:hypothetical protein